MNWTEYNLKETSMILHRITKHVKAQNWLAVGIEFIIVVVGVVMGIQVSNWNETRLSRIEEQHLVVQLHNETLELIELLGDEAAVLRDRQDVLLSLRPILFMNEPARKLSSDECRMIAISHIRPKPSDGLPTLESMLANGRIDVLRNQLLKNQLMKFSLYRERARAWHDEGAIDLFRLAHLYPNLLQLGFVELDDAALPPDSLLSVDGYRYNVKCDLQPLRESPALLNDLIDNLGRLSAALKYSYDGMEEQLEILRATLAVEIGVDDG